MKFIHCSDLHLDSKMETNLDAQKAKLRKRELLLNFERLVDYACANNCDGIIIAGDMFDTSRIKIETRNRVINTIINHENIDFYYLSGNHDEDNFLSQIGKLPNNLKLFNESWTSYQLGDVVITGTKLNKSNSSSVFDTLNLDKDKINIVVLHGQTSKYNLHDDCEKINLNKLKNKNIDYLALGHIHTFEINDLDSRGKYCYCGCLEGRGFDECGSKGFVMIDIQDNKIEELFVPFSRRELIELSFDISNYNNWFDVERDILKKLDSVSKDNFIKLILVGKYDLNLDKQIEILSQKLNENFFFAKIVDNSKLQVDIENIKNDMSLKGEFIRTILNSDMADDEKDRVILTGIKALNGEDL